MPAAKQQRALGGRLANVAGDMPGCGRSGLAAIRYVLATSPRPMPIRQQAIAAEIDWLHEQGF